jgi:hypothetical protein
MTRLNKDKLRKQLRKKRKHREMRAQRPPVSLKPASAHQTSRFARDHLDVLQNIEFAIVSCYREDPHGQIDDATVMRALQRSLLGESPDVSPVGLLMEAIAAVRSTRDDTPDSIWNDAMRVVMASIENHSSRDPGKTEYLDFVDEFIV